MENKAAKSQVGEEENKGNNQEDGKKGGAGREKNINKET